MKEAEENTIFRFQKKRGIAKEKQQVFSLSLFCDFENKGQGSKRGGGTCSTKIETIGLIFSASFIKIFLGRAEN